MKAALLALALLLAGCSSRSERTRVKIGNGGGGGLQIWAMPATLADSLGYYRDEGLDVTLENLPTGPPAIRALLGGSVDVAVYMYEHNVLLAAQGQRVRSFFIATSQDGKVLVVCPSAVNKIHSLSDLKGALIGVSAAGATTQTWLEYSLAAHGLPKSEYRTVPVGIGSSAFAAMENGRVDAAVITGGDQFQFHRRHPDLRILLDAITPRGMRESYGSETFAGGALNAKQEWLDRNPGTARHLAKALQRTLQWIATHTPREIHDKLPEGMRSQDASLDREIIGWGQATYTADGAMPPGAPEVIKRYLDATVDKVRDSRFDLAATWTNEFLPGMK